MLIYLLIFIFVTVTPEIKLEKLKSSYKADYNYYCIQKNGSVLKNIADSHFLFTGTLLGTGIYQHIKYKNMPLLEKLPQLLIPISTGYLGERFIEFLGKREYENAKKNSTENYQILKHCFEILEKKEKMAEITQTDFLEQYDDNYKKTTNETYDKINKTIFKREENFYIQKG